MFFKRKLPKPEIQSLLEIEKRIIDGICTGLNVINSEKLKGQLPYFKFLRRLPLPSTIVVELYPESMDSIPDELLFQRREEFIIANIKFKNAGTIFTARACIVLGALFYLKTKPNYLQIGKGEVNNLEMIKVETFL